MSIMPACVDLEYGTAAPPLNEELVRVAGVEPAWTCAQDMWVAATLHPDCRGGQFQPSPF